MCAITALYSQCANYGFDEHWPVHLHQTTENVFLDLQEMKMKIGTVLFLKL